MARDPYETDSPRILASILASDFARLGEEVRDVLSAAADAIHVDVMDGHFVPNITLGPPIVASLRKTTDAFLDVHLMISDPLRYAPAFVNAGADGITFHVEAVDDPLAAVNEIRGLGCRVGITLKPATPLESVFVALPAVDLVLVMSVEPGFGGQSFMPDQLDKVRELRHRIGPKQRIEIDGGITPHTIGQAYTAGVQWFVVGSALFSAKDRTAAIRSLRDAIG